MMKNRNSKIETRSIWPAALLLAFILQPLAFSLLLADPASTTQVPVTATTGTAAYAKLSGTAASLSGTINGATQVIGPVPSALTSSTAAFVNIPSTHVLFVDANGNDATAAVGDPIHPWADWQTAYTSGTAYSAAHSNCLVLLKGGIVSGTGIVLASAWNSNVELAGLGPTLTTVGGITGDGANGSGQGGNGNGGYDFSLTSDNSVDIGDITLNGGNGTDDTDGLGEGGGQGGNGGNVTLVNVYSSGAITTIGGNGGWDTAGDAQPGGNSGNGGNITFTGCTVLGIQSAGGSPGASPYAPNSAGDGGVVTGSNSTVGSDGIASNGSQTAPFGAEAPTGSGGSITLTRVTCLGDLNALAQSNGYMANGGVINCTSCSLDNITVQAGGGTAGTITLTQCAFVYVNTNGGTANDVCADGTPAVSNPFTGDGTSSDNAMTTNITIP